MLPKLSASWITKVPPYMIMMTMPIPLMKVVNGLKKALSLAISMFMSKYLMSSAQNLSSSNASLLKPLTTRSPLKFSCISDVMTPFCSLTACHMGRIRVLKFSAVISRRGSIVMDTSVR